MAITLDADRFFEASMCFYQSADIIDEVFGEHLNQMGAGTQILDEIRNALNSASDGLGLFVDSSAFQSTMSESGSNLRWLSDELRRTARNLYSIGLAQQQLLQLIMRQLYNQVDVVGDVFSNAGNVLSLLPESLLKKVPPQPVLGDVESLVKWSGVGLGVAGTGLSVLSLWRNGDHDPHDLIGTAIGGIGEVAIGTAIPPLGIGLAAVSIESQIDQYIGTQYSKEGIIEGQLHPLIGNAMYNAGLDLTIAGKNMDPTNIFTDAGKIVWDLLPFVSPPGSSNLALSPWKEEATNHVGDDFGHLVKDVGLFGLSFLQESATNVAMRVDTFAKMTANYLPPSPFSGIITGVTNSIAEHVTDFANAFIQNNPTGIECVQ